MDEKKQNPQTQHDARYDLDPYEQEIENAAEATPHRSLGPQAVEQVRELARRSIAKKESRINIRLNPGDIGKLRQRAERDGIPYQTLISSIVHRFVEGHLVDVDNVEAVRRALGIPQRK